MSELELLFGGLPGRIMWPGPDHFIVGIPQYL